MVAYDNIELSRLPVCCEAIMFEEFTAVFPLPTCNAAYSVNWVDHILHQGPELVVVDKPPGVQVGTHAFVVVALTVLLTLTFIRATERGDICSGHQDMHLRGDGTCVQDVHLRGDRTD